MSPAAFDEVLRRETARAARTDAPLSVVILSVQPTRRTDLPRAAALLKRRSRISDSLAWLDGPDRRLAALLPDTTERGAWSYADDLARLAQRENLALRAEIFSLPDGPPGPPPPEHPSPARRHRERARLYLLPRENGARGRLRTSRRRNGTVPATPATPGTKDLSLLLLEPLPTWKRLFDATLSGLLLLLLAPLFVVIALGIKLSSPGPVFFSQARAGLGGRPFRFFKFRSMRLEADAQKHELRDLNEADGPVFKVRDDPRITAIGRFLRRTSLDELPQLWNVLKGDMTLVGPRPPTLDEVGKYARWHRQRLHVTGGITCIWQVSGRSEVGFADWVRMDIRYQRERRHRIRQDLRLLARTVSAVVSCRGAY